MKKVLLIAALIASLTGEAVIDNVDSTGCRDGVWTSDVAAGRSYAKKNGRPYIFVWGNNQGGCGLCNAAAKATWNKDDFKAWAAENKIALVVGDMAKGDSASKTFIDLYLSGVSGIALPVFALINGEDGKSRYGYDMYHSASVATGDALADVRTSGVTTGALPTSTPLAIMRHYINQNDNSPTTKTRSGNYTAIGPQAITPDAEGTKEAKLSLHGLYGDWEVNDISCYNYLAAGSGKFICKSDDNADWYTFSNAKANTSYVIKTPTLTDKSKEGFLGVYTTESAATAATKGFAKAKSNATYWFSMTDLKKGKDFVIPKKGTVWLLFTRRDAADKENITVKYTFTLQVGSLETDKFSFTTCATEIEEATTNQTISIGLDRTLATMANDATVSYANGTALAGVDYVKGSTKVSFSGTEKNANLPVTILASTDGVWTGDRMFTVNITADGKEGGVTNHTVTIKEMDAEFDDADPADDEQLGAQNLSVAAGVENRLNSTDTVDWFKLPTLPADKIFRLTASPVIFNNITNFTVGFYNGSGMPLGEATLNVSAESKTFDLPPAWFADGDVYAKVSRTAPAAGKPACCVYGLALAEIDKPVVQFAGNQVVEFDSPSADINATFAIAATEWPYEPRPTVCTEALVPAVEDQDYAAIANEELTNDSVTVTLKDAGMWRPERSFKLVLASDENGFYKIGDSSELAITLKADAADPNGATSSDNPIAIGETFEYMSRNLSNTNTEDSLFFSVESGKQYVLAANDVRLKPANAEINVTMYTNVTVSPPHEWVACGEWSLSDLADPSTMPLLAFSESGLIKVVASRNPDETVLAEYALGLTEWQTTEISFEKAAWTNSQDDAVLSYTLVRTGDMQLPATALVTLECGTARAGVDVAEFQDMPVTFDVGCDTATLTVDNLMATAPNVWRGDRTFTLSVKVDETDAKLAVGEPKKADVTLESEIPEYEEGDSANESIESAVSTNALAYGWTETDRTLHGEDDKDFFIYTSAIGGVRYRFTVVLDETSTNGVAGITAIFYANGVQVAEVEGSKIVGNYYDFTPTADGDIAVKIARNGGASPVSMAYTLKARQYPRPVFSISADKDEITDAEGSSVTFTVMRTENNEETNTVTLTRAIVDGTAQSGFAASDTWPAEAANKLTLVFPPEQETTNVVCTVKTGKTGIWTGDWSFTATLATEEAATDIDAYASVTNVVVKDCDDERDERDPADDTKAGADGLDGLVVYGETHVLGDVRLNGSDVTDWIRFSNIESNKTYLFQLSDANLVNISAANIAVQFVQDDTTNGYTFAEVAANPVQFRSQSANDIYVCISREDTSTLAKPISVAYALNYRVQAAVVYLTAGEVLSTEAAKYVPFDVVCKTDAPLGSPVSVTLTPKTLEGDKATAPADFDGTPINVTWGVGSTGGVKRVKVKLTNNDTQWEGDETFHVELTVDDGAELSGELPEEGMYNLATVVLAEINAPAYGTIELTGSSTKADDLKVKAVTSATTLKTREGGEVALRFSRKSGFCGDVLARFYWYNGKTKLKTISNVKLFEEFQDGTTNIVLAVPTTAGFQKTQTFTLKYALMSSCNATIKKKSLTALDYTVVDADYAGKVATYSADDPTKVPFTASGTTWYADFDGAIRSSTPAAGKNVVLTAPVTGPGTLKFTATFENAANCTLTVKGGAKNVKATATGDYEVPLKAGKQTLTFTFARAKTGTKATAAVIISDVSVEHGEEFNTIGTFYGDVAFVSITGTAAIVSNGDVEMTVLSNAVTNVTVCGSAKMTVATTGKVSGKFVMEDGRTWTFSSTTAWNKDDWTMAVTAKSGDWAPRNVTMSVDPETGIVTSMAPEVPDIYDEDDPVMIEAVLLEMARDRAKDVPQERL